MKKNDSLINNKQTIKINHQEILINRELFEAMERPKKLRLLPLNAPDIAFIKKFTSWDVANLGYRYLINLLGQKKYQLPKILHYKKQVKDWFVFEGNNYQFDFQNYYSINYHPFYYLNPIDEIAEANSREQSWGKIKNYHEHLQTNYQDEDAKKVSQWLAKEIFRPLGGKTFLELGCGAGRNLLYIHKSIRGAKTRGMDINKQAIMVAKKELKKYPAKVAAESLYHLSKFPDKSIDIVFTAGVLMHIPHDKVGSVVKEMHRIAKKAVVHFELDGPSHNFDYHRYPRDYAKLYQRLKIKPFSYEVYHQKDFRSNFNPPFAHALLVYKF